jgi:hypothetical protein
MWNVATTNHFDDWFSEIGKEAQIAIKVTVNLLAALGPKLGRPHADTLNGSKHANMKELRVDTKAMVLRIAFAFDPNRAAILLVAGDKSGVSQKRFYKQLIGKADALYDAHLNALRAQRESKGN